MKKFCAHILKVLLYIYLKTLRIHISGDEQVRQALIKGPLIFMVWHDSLLLTPLLQFVTKYRPIYILISKSRDGDIPSLLAASYKGVDVVRVKHTGRPSALKESCRLLHEGKSLIITPDGPRGPRHVIKGGMLYASEKEHVPVVHVTWSASREHTLSSWDKFRIPFPFSKIELQFEKWTQKSTDSTASMIV